jgi:TolB-like protein
MKSLPRAAHLLWTAAALALALFTTGGAPMRHSAGGVLPPDHPQAALMPFENLAGHEEQSTLFTRIFFAQLVASGALEMTDPVAVDAAMDSLRIRASGSMTIGQARAIADTLHVPYLILGSVLECGTIRTPDGEIPSVGATLRVVQVATGRVVWAGVHFRSGEDHETLFGWGREKCTDKLIMLLAQDMLEDFRKAGAAYARRTQTEKKP